MRFPAGWLRKSILLWSIALLPLAAVCGQPQPLPQDESSPTGWNDSQRPEWTNGLWQLLDGIETPTGILYIPAYLPQGFMFSFIHTRPEGPSGVRPPSIGYQYDPHLTFTLTQYEGGVTPAFLTPGAPKNRVHHGTAMDLTEATPEVVMLDSMKSYRLEVEPSGGIVYFIFQKEGLWFEIGLYTFPRDEDFEATEIAKVAASLFIWQGSGGRSIIDL